MVVFEVYLIVKFKCNFLHVSSSSFITFSHLFLLKNIMDFLFFIGAPKCESFKMQTSLTFCTINRNTTNRWLQRIINYFTFTCSRYFKKYCYRLFQTSEYNITECEHIYNLHFFLIYKNIKFQNLLKRYQIDFSNI